MQLDKERIVQALIEIQQSALWTIDGIKLLKGDRDYKILPHNSQVAIWDNCQLILFELGQEPYKKCPVETI